MRRLLVALACLAFAGTARAEYLSGFTLLGHGGDAVAIAEVRLDAEGRASDIEMLRGAQIKGSDILDRTGALKRYRPKGAERAILFLSSDGSLESDTDVAWIDGESLVHLLPDNYGYGVFYPLAYRAPTVEQFRRSLTAAASDRREIARIAALPSGPERAMAVSRLIGADRPENGWYVYFGTTLAVRLRLPLWAWDQSEEHSYREEVCLSLFAVGVRWSGEERAAFRAATAALAPGEVRREHLRLLIGQGVEPADADLFAGCHVSASDPRERVLAARGLLLAEAKRGERVILSDLVLERWEVARRLLPLLQDHKGEGRDRFLDAVDRLADALLAADEGAYPNLGYGLSSTLKAGGRKSDLARLLAMARSACAFKAQALVDLQQATENRWERDDPRWAELVR